jgi:hypothetical protein
MPSHHVNSLIAVNDSGWKPTGTVPAVVKLRTLPPVPAVTATGFGFGFEAGSVSVAAIALAASAAPTPAAIPTVGARRGIRCSHSNGRRQRRRFNPRSVAATSCSSTASRKSMLMPAPSL